jgi:hypothetical protein
MTKPEPETLPLFPTRQAGPRLAPPIPKNLSKRKRRTARKSQLIDMGKHPAIGLPLHPWAPKLNAAPADRTPRDWTCGTCVHLKADVSAGGNRRLYCELSISQTEVRRWWPACVQTKPIEDGQDA